ncbi:LysR family transcriptional regulator [Jeotgalibaca caeni]|uniref:LysR family transcriptional regulator n=1 Tax=Jeotgalibaca caeni TaxID=3028623 RepID=UPI00237E0D5C|nr:LysR family transcriptional regulator [Jeotgalibaca caeni]MDE1547609.1 LysR family transcriptional regulator [Jeotgalibaca caeni]
MNALRTFQVVAEELNFSRAAIKLNYSQPTITKHIQYLEDELGVVLLERNNGKYALTRAGHELFNHSIVILREMNAISNLSSNASSLVSLKLQGHDYYCYRYFIPAIKKMALAYPNVSFKIEGSNNETTVSQLLRNEIDLGIISGNVLPSEFESCVIGHEEVALCVNKQIYKSNKTSEDYLTQYPIVIDESEYYNTENIFPYIALPLNIIDSSSDEVVQESILLHNMVGVVRTGRLQSHIDSGEIIVVESLIKNDPIYIIKNKANRNNAAISALYDIVCEIAHPRNKHMVKWI